MKWFLFLFAVFALHSAPVLAEAGIVDAGVPDLFDTRNYSDEDVFDIYSRHFEYAAQRLEFRRDLEDRRKSFAAPQSELLGGYQQRLAAFNRNRVDFRGLGQ